MTLARKESLSEWAEPLRRNYAIELQTVRVVRGHSNMRSDAYRGEARGCAGLPELSRFKVPLAYYTMTPQNQQESCAIR